MGAFWTVKTIREQIKLSDDHEKDRVLRENRKNRALLPQALSDMRTYVEDCAGIIRDINDNNGETDLNHSYISPTLPREALLAIGRSIQTASSLNSKRLAGILASAQVQNSRLKSFVEQANVQISEPHCGFSETRINEAIFDLISLSKLLDCAYNYGRGESDTVRDVCEAPEASQAPVFLMGWNNDDLRQLIERRWPPSFHDFAHNLEDW